MAFPAALSACSAAPAQNILGSFFPAWMLCASIGVGAAILARLCLGAIGIEASVPAPPLTYIALAAAITLLVWLLWFGH